jgi:hypothetical protein
MLFARSLALGFTDLFYNVSYTARAVGGQEARDQCRHPGGATTRTQNQPRLSDDGKPKRKAKHEDDGRAPGRLVPAPSQPANDQVVRQPPTTQTSLRRNGASGMKVSVAKSNGRQKRGVEEEPCYNTRGSAVFLILFWLNVPTDTRRSRTRSVTMYRACVRTRVAEINLERSRRHDGSNWRKKRFAVSPPRLPWRRREESIVGTLRAVLPTA